MCAATPQQYTYLLSRPPVRSDASSPCVRSRARAAFAIGYAAEGGLTDQYSSEKFPLTAALKDKGLTDEKWDEICKSLAAGKGTFGMDGGFSKAIAKANEDFLDKIGCIGAYAEYGPGQKCMVVLTKEAATPDVVTMP